MGFLESMEKMRKRMTLSGNKMQGRMSEQNAMTASRFRGNEVQRTGHGSDYRERKVDLFTGQKGSWTYVEHKSGGAQLSPLQKKTMKKTSRYRVERD